MKIPKFVSSWRYEAKSTSMKVKDSYGLQVCFGLYEASDRLVIRISHQMDDINIFIVTFYGAACPLGATQHQFFYGARRTISTIV